MFKYRLEPVLRYRKNLEEQGIRGVAGANRKYMTETRSLGAINDMKGDAMDWMRDIYNTAPEARLFHLYNNWVKGLNSDIFFGQRKLEGAKKKLDEERGKLIELVKRRRVMELHRDKLKERHDKEQDRIERNQADELAMSLFARKG